VLENRLLARKGYEHSIFAFDHRRVLDAPIPVDSKERIRGVTRILDHFDQSSILEFGEIDFVFE
jgi:hypothetical protein